ncbi:MAG: hypothetical protein AAF985_15495 [Bacteroidota bacterium]
MAKQKSEVPKAPQQQKSASTQQDPSQLKATELSQLPPEVVAQQKLQGYINSSPLTKRATQFQQTADQGAVSQQKQSQTSSTIQRIKIGSENVTNVTKLAVHLKISEDNIISKFNEKLDTFPNVDKGQFNSFLYKRTTKVGVGVTEVDKFIQSLARSYVTNFAKFFHSNFQDGLDGMAENNTFTNLMEGGYVEEGVDDGASIKDDYDKALACSLFAILAMKPGFLGANSPKELHYILRANPKTRKYDNDKEVAQIRIAAGLTPTKPDATENTLSKLTSKYDAGKFIIDPSGQAHTFVLTKTDDGWRKIDNDNPGGVAVANCDIRYYWKD